MKTKVLFSVVLVLALGALSIGALAHAEVITPPDASSSSINDPHLLAGGENSDQPEEFWTVDGFKNWMEQQRDANQKLADKADKSFCEKDADGNYVYRTWTQEDVDLLYAQWQNQLKLMEEGYQFTKPIDTENGAFLAGAIDPDTWNAKLDRSLSTTIITLPDGTTVDLGHFDTAEEAKKEVSTFLDQQVNNGSITQAEADAILKHGSIE